MTFRTPLATLAAASLALGAAACGSTSDAATNPASSASAPEPVASVPALTGKGTAVTLDGDFVKALTSLEVAPGPVGDATISKAGVANFPITGGNVKYFTPGTVTPYVQGMIMHDGSGLSLTAGGKKVELTDFVVDPGKSVLTGKVSLNGKEVAASAPLFFLDGRTLKPLKTGAGDTAILEGTTVKLKEEAAALLNTTYGITALKAGLVVGVAKITVNTK